MEVLKVLFGLCLFMTGIAFMLWKVGQYFQRGWKDHVWIFREAKRGAGFILFLFGSLALLEYFLREDTSKTIAIVSVAIIGAIIPFASYTTGRLSGMWWRSRDPKRIS